ncbi:MAG: glycosyl hydrolase family 28-related protein [Pseudomonadota bacterium]
MFNYREVDPATEAAITTARGARLEPLSDGGCYVVDAFGAVGDGVTDDTQAIQSALDAIPSGATLRFSSARTYLVSREIVSTDEKSLTVLAHGAVIKCADDSVWHVFKLGGPSESRSRCEIRWHGGCFDGNLEHQRYYPNTNGTKIYTDQGEEAYGAHLGTPFYENSIVNGTEWDNGWITGRSKDGIDVNGGGNDGLVRVQHAERAIFEDIECRNFVRNGLATWNAKDVHARRIRGVGQLPTTYFELVRLFDLGHEAALMKFSGNSKRSVVGGNYSERVTVSDCYSEGGVMPLFIRTNPPKSPSTGVVAKVSRCQFYGIARELWFETCQSVTVRDCEVTCADYPGSSFRKDPAIFMGSGTQDWTIDNCYVFGRINTNVPQARRVGSFVNSVLIDYADGDQRPLECELISDSYIESRSGGVLADRISGSRLFLENRSSSDSFKVRRSITSSTIGREWFDGARERLVLEPGAEEVQLSGWPDVIQAILFRRRDFCAGRWYEAHASDYAIDGDRLSLRAESGFDDLEGPIEIEVDWFADRVDEFRVDPRSERQSFTLTRTGGCRRKDIVSIHYEDDPVPHRQDITDPATDIHWHAVMGADGHMTFTLENLNVDPSLAGTVVIRYRPPLRPYRALETTTDDTEIDVTGENFGGIVVDGGRNHIRGRYRDIAGPAFLLFKDRTQLVELKDVRLDRLDGGLLCGINSKAKCREGVVRNCHVKDWMIQSERLIERGLVMNNKAIGFQRRNGTRFDRRFIFANTVMEYSGDECGSSQNVGNNQGGVLVGGYAAVGGNAYLGVDDQLRLSVGKDSVLLTTSDSTLTGPAT